ncbi:MAG: HD domain-containing protein [Nanoarchaeota archaeon]|nr:HD domain-containing protein [Nanoarchaeota archaeon]
MSKLLEELASDDVELIRLEQIKVSTSYELLISPRLGKFARYKPAGVTIDTSRIDNHTLPARLYIRKEDSMNLLRAAQENYSGQLKQDLSSKDPEKIKTTFTTITAETLAEPRGATLEGLTRIIESMIESFLRDPKIMLNLINMASSDKYDTTIHCTNACILTLACCLRSQFPREITISAGKGAIVHDIGKTEEGFQQDLIHSESRLTDLQYEAMRSHTDRGYRVLSNSGITDGVITQAVYQHHEKLDGSGYPRGLSGTNVSIPGRVIALVNFYDRMTYGGVIVPRKGGGFFRRKHGKKEALQKIARDVAAGALDRDLFKEFIQLIRQ